MRMRHIVICDLPVSTIFFFTLSHNGTIFGQTLLNIKCVLSFSLQILCETVLTLRSIQRDAVTKVHSFSCKVPAILVRF